MLLGSADALPLGFMTQRAIYPKEKMKNGLVIVHVNSAEEARDLAAKGFCPVECCFGSDSVVDGLFMDHHGPNSHREGVAVRAYRDHFGARRDDPRFVVTGVGDADACLAIAALVGLLPHPSRAQEFASAPAPVKQSFTKDITQLAKLVNRVDIEPIGIRLESEPFGDTLLLWKQMGGGADSLAFYAGVDRWRSLTGRPLTALLDAARTEEANRVARAREAAVEKVGTVGLVESDVFGFDVWYADVAPVIVAFVERNGAITVGCRDTATAEGLFGPGGLKGVFPRLGEGWGGREAVGGSPRGQRMTREDAKAAARLLSEAMQ